MVSILSAFFSTLVLAGIVFEKDWMRDSGLIGHAGLIAYSLGMILEAITKNIP